MLFCGFERENASIFLSVSILMYHLGFKYIASFRNFKNYLVKNSTALDLESEGAVQWFWDSFDIKII